MPQTTTETRSRKSSKKKLTQEEAEVLIAKAKKEAEEKAILRERKEAEAKRLEAESDFVDEEQFEFGELEENEEEFPHSRPYYETAPPSGGEQERENSFDIFEYIESEFAKFSTPVLYRVKKSGSFVGEHYHPMLSWADIQKTYGGGNYTVEARHANTKQYIKSQTLLIHEPLNKETKREETQDRIVIPPPNPGPQVDPNKMVEGLMQAFSKMQEMTWEEKVRKERDERKGESQFNTTFVTLLQSQQQATQTMFMEMQRNTQETMKTLAENFSKVQERMDDKFTKLIDKMSETSKKKDEFGLMDLLTMQQQAEDRGWDKMKMLLDLAEAKAEERAGSDEGESKDSGIIGSLVKGILPLLSGASQQQQMLLQQQQMMQAQSNANARSLPSPRPAPQRQATGNQTRPPQRKNQGPSTQASQKTPETNQNPLGLPTFTDIESESREVTPVENPGPKTIEEIYQGASEIQQKIANLALPLIAEHIMTNQIGPRDVAGLCLDECLKNKITSDVVLREFPFDFMLQIAGAFGIGEEKRGWFEEFYAHIQDSVGMDAEGSDEFTDGE